MTSDEDANSMSRSTRATPHPLVLIATLAAAAVALIAAAQLLAPRNARSQAFEQSVAGAKHSAAQADLPNRPTPTAVTATACADCGVVVAVREAKQAGQATGVGAVAGGVLGGVLGHQFGSGRGNDLATAAGVVGGAIAGHQVEKQTRAQRVYYVDVKMDDGTMRTMTQTTPFAVGAKVRVAGKQIALRG